MNPFHWLSDLRTVGYTSEMSVSAQSPKLTDDRPRPQLANTVALIGVILAVIGAVFCLILFKNSETKFFMKNTPQKENKNRKSGMDIMDADYEEVE